MKTKFKMSYKGLVKINSQSELVEWLKANPCKTEGEICLELWNSAREKKHADMIRRALFSGKIERVRVKLKGIDSRKMYRYFVPVTFNACGSTWIMVSNSRLT